MDSTPYWSNHEVVWESDVANLNRFFDSAAEADAYAVRLVGNPAIRKVVRLEHQGPHGPTTSTLYKNHDN